MGKSMFKVAIVEQGNERLWRKYWTSGVAKGDAASAPTELGRFAVVEASSPEEAIATVQGLHPDCTVMLAGREQD